MFNYSFIIVALFRVIFFMVIVYLLVFIVIILFVYDCHCCFIFSSTELCSQLSRWSEDPWKLPVCHKKKTFYALLQQIVIIYMIDK
jgi:hypothetical protein